MGFAVIGLKRLQTEESVRSMKFGPEKCRPI